MIESRDQLGNLLVFEKAPERIVSLVPSQTELLYDLGIRPLAQTIFCKEPAPYFKGATKIGGTKNLQLEKIRSLKPDLIIGNKEENVKEQIEELQQEFPVWMSDIKNLQSALDMIEKLARLLAPDTGKSLIEEIENAFSELNGKLGDALYFIWKDPWMVCGRDSFIHDMMNKAGFENAIIDPESRYPLIALEEVRLLKPQYLLLSSEPYPFKLKDTRDMQKRFPESTVLLVDARYFSWYGSRLKFAPAYFRQLQMELNRL